jgi:hypothetical protein
VCEGVAAEILSLPMYPGLGDEQQDRIAQNVMDFASANATSRMSASALASNVTVHSA